MRVGLQAFKGIAPILRAVIRNVASKLACLLASVLRPLASLAEGRFGVWHVYVHPLRHRRDVVSAGQPSASGDARAARAR